MWIQEIEGRQYVLYEHYEKEMATKAVIHADSALPMKTKRTVLTQEMLRILLHCSRWLSWEAVLYHLNRFTLKMQYSGYKKTLRYDVKKSAINAFLKMMEKEEKGIRPINRPKSWRRAERRNQKEDKKKNWYRQGGFDSVLFVPTTPAGKLKRMYEDEIRKTGIRIKVVERTGRTLKSQLQTSDPFRPEVCGRLDCFVCTTTGKGNYQTEGITYKIGCGGEPCTKRGKYKGESAANAYTRGLRHIKDLATRDAKHSPLWRHCLTEHGGEMQTFHMSVTGTYRNDPMLRQISEAVQINNTDLDEIMNDRSEWNMTRIPRSVITTT